MALALYTSASSSSMSVCEMNGGPEVASFLLSRYDAIRTGETAEVVVLSRSRKFESFKVPAAQSLHESLSQPFVCSGARWCLNAAIWEQPSKRLC